MPDSPIVLSLCDRTGNMVKPWALAGYECWCVDLQHEPGVKHDGNMRWVGADVRTWLPPRRDYVIVFAFPPCTHLASSGARWFKEKGLSALSESLAIVESCRKICEWSDAPWMLENPIGTLSTYWRNPDYKFSPHEYGGYLPESGDDYTKATCLWVGNGFIMPPKRPVQPTQGSKMHRLPPSKDRADIRSETPMGFALAVFSHNCGGRGVEQYALNV